MESTHSSENGEQEEALQELGDESVKSRRNFLKIIGAAAVSSVATLLNGYGEDARAEGNNSNRRPEASASNLSIETPTEKDLSRFYIEYEKSDSIEGLEYIIPWYSKGHQIGPSLLGVTGRIQSRKLFEDILTRYLDVFRYKKASDMQKAWNATVSEEESGRSFMPEMIAYKDGLETAPVGNCPKRGVVSKDGSTGLFALKLTESEKNLWIPEQYRKKTVLIVRGNASTKSNPLDISSSDLMDITDKELDDLINWHQGKDYTGLLAMAKK